MTRIREEEVTSETAVTTNISTTSTRSLPRDFFGVEDCGLCLLLQPYVPSSHRHYKPCSSLTQQQ